MGLGFVLLVWAVVWTILAVVGMVVLRIATAFFTRGVTQGRQRAIRTASLFPFACIFWAATVFVSQGIVNEAALHRDFGLGDSWHCPFPNRYALMLIDVTDEGWVYNPKTQLSDDSVTEREDAVGGVRLLQVDGPYILGGSDSKSFEHPAESSDQIDSYFLLDTRTGKRTNFSTFDALRGAALPLGVQTKLEPIYTIYSRYRFTWFDAFAAALLFLPPLIASLLLVRWILRLRRTRNRLPLSA